MNLFDDSKIPLLSKALGAYTLRQKVIGSNIANITTAGYRARNVTFEEELAGASRQQTLAPLATNERHMAMNVETNGIPEAKVADKPVDGSLSDDDLASGINNVDIDFEMAELAKNQIRFKYASRLLANSFRSIQKSIKGQV
ncbi:MAG: flagellar basal body rod protein FlgB [Ignavibacteriales bacterium]|nr:flagellar basal body rod protein FlgB [Ignavibacteriales bacterium]